MSYLIDDLQAEYKESFSKTKVKGNFFKKRFSKLNHNLLARALQIYQFKANFSYGYNEIKIGNNLIIDVRFYYDYSEKYDNMDYYILKFKRWSGRTHTIFVNIYVDLIKIASYTFSITDRKSYYELLAATVWNCKKEISHKLPYQFIILLEDWCKQIIAEFENNLAKKVNDIKNNKLSEKNKAKEKHKKEKEILSKYN